MQAHVPLTPKQMDGNPAPGSGTGHEAINRIRLWLEAQHYKKNYARQDNAGEASASSGSKPMPDLEVLVIRHLFSVYKDFGDLVALMQSQMPRLAENKAPHPHEAANFFPH